ncbi:hypothetical protein SAMN05421678_11286 [Actinopolymorpha cephalotaxi]|uniref:Nucleotidyltransferase domain-containing protein n=1 Tax=Actinopolymorpha cephalotaxi TaxID=504797 RepID=A0A1I2XAP9_9ACTN|nr:hypothetical protein [Actinopolymorpha cephalotaxi]NYH86151.1 hypothetical protein [Actinopolymorpha cephalotaxi]SFH10620.1 hypothetical protein SAMN05421678_11286 [Actinopolymorpha cephalotaxi]
MPADPAEGLDADGFIVTGADLVNVRGPYDAVLADVRTTAETALGSHLHGLYLYGSVATGQAVPPSSDLDLSAIVTDAGAVETCRRLGAELSARHRSVVREVGISPGLLDDLVADNDAGRAERCFLKHYCVGVAGTDLRPGLPRCRPDKAIAREFVGELAPRIRQFTERLDAAATPAEVETVAILVARRLLMAAAVVYSIPDRTWTTARAAGAAMLGRHHPAYAVQVSRALAWVGPDRHADPRYVPPSRAAVRTLLADVGALVMCDVERYLASGD